MNDDLLAGGAEGEASRIDVVDEICDQFEQAWRSGQPPQLSKYLDHMPETADPEVRRDLLVELVMIDLECRWQAVYTEIDGVIGSGADEAVRSDPSNILPERPLLEDYVQRFPSLGPLNRLPDNMITAEFRVRDRWGECPERREYLRRFPDRRDRLSRVLPELEDAATRSTAVLESEPSAGLPRSLGRFVLLELLGQGGMGAVYKATHTKLKRTVAVKVLPDWLTGNASAVARFEREMQAVGQLSHPNLVAALDADEVEGTHLLVMEYVEGCDLGKLTDRLGPLLVTDACELIRKAAVGLHYAHEHGLVHRDIKPSNLILASDGTVKILDLGLARLRGDLSTTGDLTAAGQVMGTPDYLAPEQARDSTDVDARADLYSLGCTLYHLLAGRPPYHGPEYSSVSAKLLGHAQDPFPSIRAVRSEVPEELERILNRLTAKAPAGRPSSAAEVGEMLSEFASGADLMTLRTSSALGAVSSPSRNTNLVFQDDTSVKAASSATQRVWALGGVSTVLLFLAAWGVWSLFSPSSGKPMQPEATVEHGHDGGREGLVLPTNDISGPPISESIVVTRVRVAADKCKWKNVYSDDGVNLVAFQRVRPSRLEGRNWVNSENDASSGGEFLRKVHRVLRDNEQPSDDDSSKPWIYRDYDEFRTAFVAAASVRESFWRDPEPVLRFCDEARLAWPSDQELNDLKLKDPQTHVALVRFREEVLAFEEDPILDVMLQNKSSEPQIIHSAQIVIRNIVQSYCVRSGSMRFSMSLGSRPLEVIASYTWTMNYSRDVGFGGWQTANLKESKQRFTAKLASLGYEELLEQTSWRGDQYNFGDQYMDLPLEERREVSDEAEEAARFQAVFEGAIPVTFELDPPLFVPAKEAARISIRLKEVDHSLEMKLVFCHSDDNAQSRWISLDLQRK